MSSCTSSDIVLYMYHMIDKLLLLQFAAKQLDRNAKKCEKEEKTDKLKLKKVLLLRVIMSIWVE